MGGQPPTLERTNRVRILAFDTSGSACSAALWRDGAVAARRHEPMERGHTEALMPMLLEVLRVSDTRFDELDWLAVTTGPGSFTGIRAGLATARGIALARGLPALGVDTFATALWRIDGHVASVDDDRLRVIALDSRRREIYLKIFSSSGETLMQPDMVAPDDIAGRIEGHSIWLGGSAAPDLEGVLGDAGLDVHTLPDSLEANASDLAAIAFHRIKARDPDAAPPALAPLYLQPPRAIAPAAGGRLRP
jgi:tRNA threonylcarbamoyladenosine biosynthesis protein TsaB